MNMRDHLVYWVLPSAVTLVLIGMYFSHAPLAMTVLAPQINRELGLLEGLQNLVLAALIVLMLVRAARGSSALEYAFFGLIAAAGLFMLLEEMDYGTHYWWALNGWDMATRPVINVHNKGANSDKFKNTGDFILVVLFVIYPWIKLKGRNVWLQFLQPRRMFVLSMLAAFLLSRLAHYLNHSAPPQPNYLSDSMGEYRELFAYYVWLLYFGGLAWRRSWPATTSHSAA